MDENTETIQGLSLVKIIDYLIDDSEKDLNIGQLKTAINSWNELDIILKPKVMVGDENQILLVWDKDQHHFEIEIYKDNRKAYFYANDSHNPPYCGTNDLPWDTPAPDFIIEKLKHSNIVYNMDYCLIDVEKFERSWDQTRQRLRDSLPDVMYYCCGECEDESSCSKRMVTYTKEDSS